MRSLDIGLLPAIRFARTVLVINKHEDGTAELGYDQISPGDAKHCTILPGYPLLSPLFVV